MPVSISVLEPFYLSATLRVARRKVIHLGDEEPPILVERQRDWFSDEWLRGNEFKPKSLSKLKGIQCFPRGHRRKFWKILRIDNSLLSRDQRRRQAQEYQQGRENHSGCQP